LNPIWKPLEPKSEEILLQTTTQHEIYHYYLLNGNHNISQLQKLELLAIVVFLDSSYDTLKNYYSGINPFGVWIEKAS
jgi:hypothetical protein